MKRHLALVLALVMVLTSFSFVSAAPDFSDIAGTSYENAVNRLELLEILKGYPDGTFKPENSITRAEFAAVAVRAQGLAGVAEAATGLPSGFSDVPTWHWASGYVGTARSMGVVQGIGGGLFAPNAQVRYEEAVTMLVRALGYEPEAQARGGYPFGYLVVAEQIGLLDGARGTQGTWANRGLVAKLTDNALEIPMMVSIGFGDNIRWVVSGSKAHGDDAVYLLSKLGVDEYEGIVMENFHVNSRLDENEIRMYDLNDEKNVTLEVTGSVDVNAVLGLEVTAWAKDDVVFAVTVETDADLVAYDTVSAADKDEATLVVADDDFEWATDDDDYGKATVYVNNSKVDAEDAAGFGRIVMNDDEEIVFAYLFDFDDYGVVTEIDDEEVEFVSIEGEDLDTLDLEDYDEIYAFTKELSTMDLADLEEGMSIFFWENSDDELFVIAFDAMVEGELEEVRTRDSRVTVDGTNYSKAADALVSDDEMDSFKAWRNSSSSANDAYEIVEDYIEEDVVLYLDLDGKVMLLVTGEGVSSTVYGLVTWYTEGRTNTLTVFTKDGEEVTYDFASRSGIDDVTAKMTATERGVKAVAVELELNRDGEIEKATPVDSAYDFTKAADRERVTITNVSGEETRYITKDTVIIKAYDTNQNEIKPSVIKYEDIVDLAVNPATQVLHIIEDGSNLALLIFVDPAFQAVDDTMFAIVTGDRSVRSGDFRVELDVYGEGKAVYTIVGAADPVKDNADVKKGDLVTFRMNNKGEAVVKIVETISGTRAQREDAAEPVQEVLRNFVKIDNTDWRVTSDTLFYRVDKDGKLDGTTTFSRIRENDQVLYLWNTEDNTDKDLKVLINLTPELGQVRPAAPTFDVTFISNLAGFKVEVNGKEYEITDPEAGTKIPLEAGTYAYTATKTGYETITGNVVVTNEARTVNLEFIALPSLSYVSGNTLNVTVPGDNYAAYRVVIGGVGYAIDNAGVVTFPALTAGHLFEAKLVAVSAPNTAIVTESFFYAI